jgi:hypothetical protein
MRAYTSLLGHILGSHPQISGYYEMHLDYRDPQALQRQLALYCEHDALKPRSQFLFDKILHNDYALSQALIDSPDTRILLALRRPDESIRSIVGLFRQKPVAGRYAQVDVAADYYIQRVQALVDFCRLHSASYFYLDAEALVQQPDQVLAAIGEWLGLNMPLLQTYELFSLTGVERRGDSSRRLQSGRIEATLNDYSSIEISREYMSEAVLAYTAGRELILSGASDSFTLQAPV